MSHISGMTRRIRKQIDLRRAVLIIRDDPTAVDIYSLLMRAGGYVPVTEIRRSPVTKDWYQWWEPTED